MSAMWTYSSQRCYWKDSPALFSLREFCEEMIYYTIGQRENLHHFQKMGTVPSVKQTIMFQLWQLQKNAVCPKIWLPAACCKKTCGESAPVAQSSEIPHWLQPFEEGQSAEAPTSENVEGRTKEEVTFIPSPPSHLISNKIEGSCGPRVEYMEIRNARDETEFEAKTRVLLNRNPATAHYIEKKIDLEEFIC